MNGVSAIRLNAMINMPWSIQSYLLLMLVVTSGVGSIMTYAKINQLQQTKKSVVSEFALGESSYTVRSKGDCVGIVTFASKQEAGSLTIDGKGSIRVKLYDAQTDLSLEMQASFNALRQLGGSYLRVQSPELSFIVSTINIRPIELSARVLIPAIGDILKTEVSGPIVYEPITNDSISIKGIKSHDSFASMKLVSEQPLFKELTITRNDDGAEHVCSGKSGALDIQPILALSQTLAALLAKGMVR